MLLPGGSRPGAQQAVWLSDGGADHVLVDLDILESIKQPTLLMTGDGDLYLPPSLLRMQASHMPQAEVVIMSARPRYFCNNPGARKRLAAMITDPRCICAASRHRGKRRSQTKGA